MNKALTILIGFIHDFAAGCYAATVIAVYWLQRMTVEQPEFIPLLSGLKKEFFYLGLCSVLVVVLAGLGRTFTYVDLFYGRDSEGLRRRLLVIKHLILFPAIVVGLYWQYRMAF